MSTYNPEEYLKEQLLSIQKQTTSVDLIIRDDGSNIEKFRRLKSYCNSFPNVRLLRGTNVGFRRSYYLALKEAVDIGYDFYAYCDQDDIWMPDKISTLLESSHHVDYSELIFSNGVYFGNNYQGGNIYTAKRSFNTFLDFLYRATYGMTFFFNAPLADLLISIGSEPFDKYAHDVWTILVASTTGKVEYVDKKLVKYRQHDDNYSGIKIDNSTFVKKILNLLKFNQRIKSWTYRVSSVAKDLLFYIGDNQISEPLVKIVSAEPLKLTEKFRLIMCRRFTTHSVFQDFVLRILVLSEKI